MRQKLNEVKSINGTLYVKYIHIVFSFFNDNINMLIKTLGLCMPSER